jgi:hypothetical protein
VGSHTADYKFFSIHSDDQEWGNVNLSAPLAISIVAYSGRYYQVWFNLVINGDQSGKYWFGSSVSGALITAQIPFFVTRLTPGLGL